MISFERRIKNFKRAVGRYWIVFSVWMIRKMPYPVSQGLVRFSWVLAFALLQKHKKISRESLEIAFGKDKSVAERERIMRKSFEHIGWALAEGIHYVAHKHLLRERVAIEGLEHLKKAQAAGKGVVGVTAHFGNFPLLVARLVNEGFEVNVILRQARDPKIQRYFNHELHEAGVKYIFSRPRRACLLGAINVLRNNELLAILADQHFGASGGVYVDFFGRPALTAPGPVVFARRTGAAIVPMFITRNDDGTHVIHIEPAMELEDAHDEQEWTRRNVAKMTGVIERYIRMYPHEWAWMHRRWKDA